MPTFEQPEARLIQERVEARSDALRRERALGQVASEEAILREYGFGSEEPPEEGQFFDMQLIEKEDF